MGLCWMSCTTVGPQGRDFTMDIFLCCQHIQPTFLKVNEDVSTSWMMAFINSVSFRTACGDLDSRERKAFDICSRIILGNRHIFYYVGCVLAFVWIGQQLQRSGCLPQQCACNSFHQFSEVDLAETAQPEDLQFTSVSSFSWVTQCP